MSAVNVNARWACSGRKKKEKEERKKKKKKKIARKARWRHSRDTIRVARAAWGGNMVMTGWHC